MPYNVRMLYKDFLKSLTGCPFCGGENRIISDTESAYLTYALAPYHKHHLLILPKRHTESIQDITEQEDKDIEQLQRLGMSLLKKLGYESITFLVREGGLNEIKSVAHIHYHLIPKIQIGDLDHYGQERRILSDEEIQGTVHDIELYL